MRAALKVAAPALLEPSDETLSLVTAENVRRLFDELSRLQEQVEKGGNKPRALVRAFQLLYLAESTRDASLSLSTETADEEALRQLTERTEEFAPALAAMRGLAVDYEIFSHLREQMDEEEQVLQSESEASDVCKELIGKNEPNALVLPPGWRLEWVRKKRGGRQSREYVDPYGGRYYNVKEVRAAIEALEAVARVTDAMTTEEQDSVAPAAMVEEDANLSGEPPPMKRTRLRGKVSAPSIQPPEDDLFANMFGAGDLEAAFEEALDGALSAAASNAGAPLAPVAAVEEEPMQPPEPAPGVRVMLKGLMAKPELNGKPGRLGVYNPETTRWECMLDDGVKVNVKTPNFDVLPHATTAKPALVPAKRATEAAAGDAARRVRARGNAKGTLAAAPSATQALGATAATLGRGKAVGASTAGAAASARGRGAAPGQVAAARGRGTGARAPAQPAAPDSESD